MVAIVRIMRKLEKDRIESSCLFAKKRKNALIVMRNYIKLRTSSNLLELFISNVNSLIHQTVKTAIRRYKLENERKRHCDLADDTKPSMKRKISLHKGYQIIGKDSRNIWFVGQFGKGAEEKEEEEDDDEDCENNWRNDYPDESSWFYNADPNFSCYDYGRDYG
ncbi:hypothetical protein HELRODRAFT_182086 [Helobdella robusta]|uniref:Probable RNA polymerase II nuclear localization protein SLC7A6OS n=1 Tax=Helobdella robusta TaxID=6412 RepID=T1FHQ0_HELRO|nr:hypothetical protein HELRODRAFT_182086 [Helobdella robusta]ESN91231.1 hypothetical protein HELRODRAFT_182086 [Helobdella robusta]